MVGRLCASQRWAPGVAGGDVETQRGLATIFYEDFSSERGVTMLEIRIAPCAQGEGRCEGQGSAGDCCWRVAKQRAERANVWT